MRNPADIAARYLEVHVDNDECGAVIKDRATGETVLIFGNRRWQRLVLQWLNVADSIIDKIETRETPAA